MGEHDCRHLMHFPSNVWKRIQLVLSIFNHLDIKITSAPNIINNSPFDGFLKADEEENLFSLHSCSWIYFLAHNKLTLPRKNLNQLPENLCTTLFRALWFSNFQSNGRRRVSCLFHKTGNISFSIHFHLFLRKKTLLPSKSHPKDSFPLIYKMFHLLKWYK